MVSTFADFQAAADAANKTPATIVLIAGTPVEVREWTADHGVRQPVGIASLTVDAPLPDGIDIGATVQIQAGYDTLAAYVFQGIIPDDAITFSDDGTVAHISADGYGRWLARRDYSDRTFLGPIGLKTLYTSLASYRQLPSFRADDTTYPDGATEIRLGGVTEVENGAVVIERRTSSGRWLNAIGNLFGYYAFDLPSGPNRFQMVSGIPNTAPVATFVEGATGYSYERRRDMSALVNYWEIKGARYTDADGVNVAIRSIPAEVPYDPLLAPTGYEQGEDGSDLLVTIALADAVRNVKEIDHSAPHITVTWEDEGRPDIQPGDVVHVTAPSIGVDADLWVLRTQHRFNDAAGFVTTFEGWAGAGEALAPGEDCVTIPIAGGPWHLGDETLSHYAVPSPSPGPVKLSFTVEKYYSSITVRAKGHGCNSYMLSGKNAESTVSKFEIWQFGEKVGSGDLPVLPENLERRLAYDPTKRVVFGDGSVKDPIGYYYWSDLVIPITGNLEPGPAELHIISGNDTRASGGPRDDFEVAVVSVTTCGVGEPILPTGGTP